jgi:hypothetical protein
MASGVGDIGQLVAVCMKSPLNWKALIRSGLVVLEFVIVMVLNGLVVPTSAEKVVIDVGETVTGGFPAFTVSTSGREFTPPWLAVMFVVPNATPVACPPLAVMVATDIVSDVHITLAVMSLVEASL